MSDTDLAERVWRRQFAQAREALAPWARRTPDGFDYVDPSAPRTLTAGFALLASVGYARGWL